MSVLNNILIVKYTSSEKGDQFKEDLVNEICSWEGFNTNEDLTNWRYYSTREGLIVLGCNDRPEVDWEKLFKSYDCLKRLVVFHTTKYSFESLPYFYEQDYSIPCMKILDNFRICKVNWEQVCNFKMQED